MDDMYKFKVFSAYFLGASIEVTTETSKDGKQTTIKGKGFTILITSHNYFQVWVYAYEKKTFRSQIEAVYYLDNTVVQ